MTRFWNSLHQAHMRPQWDEVALRNWCQITLIRSLNIIRTTKMLKRSVYR